MHTKIRWVVPPMAALLLGVGLSSCSKEEPAAAELAAIESAWEVAIEAADEGAEDVGLEATQEERRAARKQRRAAEEERVAELKSRYEALAEEYWGTEAALDAKLWLMKNAVRAAEEEEREAVLAQFTDPIFDRYARSPHMEKLVPFVREYTAEQIDHYFGDLRENSPHASVRAASYFYPATHAISSLRWNRDENPDTVGVRAKAEALLQLLIDEYSETPKGGSTYGIMADAHLNAYTKEELAIGQPAPELVGETIDGQEILLSQFKGKVTVFYFWGDW